MRIECPNCGCSIPLLPLIYTNSADKAKAQAEEQERIDKEAKQRKDQQAK